MGGWVHGWVVGWMGEWIGGGHVMILLAAL